jgi:hydroxymethylglutaryl-CoA reductase
MNSKISGFYKLSVEERLKRISQESMLSIDDAASIAGVGLGVELADKMVENVVGTFELPFGVAVNFKINSKDTLIPMVTEEPSVVAAASNAAKMIREGGGFTVESTEPLMIGQIQLIECAPDAAKKIALKKEEYLKFLEGVDPTLVKFGGGPRDMEVREFSDMVVAYLHVNVADAMGANAVNTMCESLAPKLEQETGGKAVLKIITNYALLRTATARATVPKNSVGGSEVVDRILWAQRLAQEDVYRAVTHNKGIMNGVTAVVLATGNDTRAVEAGCHAYAAKDGRYTSLTMWRKNENGDLDGELTLPVAVGLVGGATKTHPVAKAAVKILGVKSSRELGEVLACVGLAQNLAAIRALASEGIQKGHMRLHAKNIALLAGATGDKIDAVAEKMTSSGAISVDAAKKILEGL